MTRLTQHLVPAEVWGDADPIAPYAAASLAEEGFIHCTDGDAELLRTAERHYRADPRAFLALTIDLDAVSAPWRMEDAARIYPHVFGLIERSAITNVRVLVRDSDGQFLGLQTSDPQGSAS